MWRHPREFSTLRGWRAFTSRFAGERAGNFNKKDGYWRISYKHYNYLLHRLAYLYVEGVWPEEHIDHINHIPSDNRWVNLRAVSRSENMRNQKLNSNSTSGVAGVSWYKAYGKWSCRIVDSGKDVFLGYFDTLEEAAVVRKRAEAFYNYHDNHGGVFLSTKGVAPQKQNLFSYEVMKRAVELYEDTEMTMQEQDAHYGSDYLWSWCVNTALAEHNYAVD